MKKLLVQLLFFVSVLLRDVLSEGEMHSAVSHSQISRRTSLGTFSLSVMFTKLDKIYDKDLINYMYH